jgi:hypothetical protein
MKIRFECEHCYEPLQADVSMRGEMEQCPNCRQLVRIPTNAELAPSPDWARDYFPGWPNRR